MVLRLSRVALLCALAALAIAALPAPASAQAQRTTTLVAIWQGGPERGLSFEGPEPPYEGRDLFLRFLARQPGVSIGLMSTVQGDYTHEQALLDISQGTHQSGLVYQPKDLPPLLLAPDGGGGRILHWNEGVRRAATGSATIQPGLLASTVPGGAGYVGVTARNLDGALAAADRTGRVAAVSIGPAASLAARAQAMLQAKRLVVVSVPADAAGRSALSSLITGRQSGEQVIVAQVPFTPAPAERQAAKEPTRFYKLAAFGLDDGGPGRGVTSATTRQRGLVSAIDVAPTALTHLGLRVPLKMRGEPIAEGERVPVERLEQLRRRWSDIRTGRQSASLRAVAAVAFVIFMVLGAWRGFGEALPRALRIGALAMVWWPTMVLASAALEPEPLLLESAIIALPSIALGALTDRLMPWPRGPLLPAAVGLIAYTVDLAVGDLLNRSVLGPSPVVGARFFGVGNELEPLFPILLLGVLAAVYSGRPLSRRIVWMYALSGLAVGVVIGWGRLGADVGGVLTVAGSMTVAALVMLPGGITRRTLALAALVPVAALAALIVIDLLLSGGGHLSRNLLRAESAGELWELVARRYELAAHAVVRGRTPAYFAAAAIAVAFAWRNRELIYGSVRHEHCWQALLLGGLASGVIGMLTNDSGPILLINAVVALAAVSAYLFGKPGVTLVRREPEPAGGTASGPAERRSADPVLSK